MRRETEELALPGKRTGQGADSEHPDGHVRLWYTDIMMTVSDHAISA
jgi:hypothetical protein